MMRDIRSDLQERAHLCEEQIRAACAQFDAMVQHLQSERDMRIADLRSGLALIERCIEFESSLMGNVVTLDNSQVQRLSLADRIRAASNG
jgi:hypothetical protein